MRHDPICPVRDDPARQDHCGVCVVIANARDDERDRMRNHAASATVTTDGRLSVLTVDDPHGIGWVPVSTDLIEALIEQRNADVERICADERERIAQAIEETARDKWVLGTDWVNISVRIARDGGRE